MAAYVRVSDADLENLKAEIAADVSGQLKEFLAKQLAEGAAVQSDRSVAGFRRRWGISRFLFYDMQKDGTAPRVMAAGGRRLISPQAETEWIAACEALALTEPKRVVGRPRARCDDASATTTTPTKPVEAA